MEGSGVWVTMGRRGVGALPKNESLISDRTKNELTQQAQVHYLENRKAFRKVFHRADEGTEKHCTNIAFVSDIGC